MSLACIPGKAAISLSSSRDSLKAVIVITTSRACKGVAKMAYGGVVSCFV